jgi:hypothetical protein
MRALSFLQPWTWAILHAGKRIENRSWNITARGEFLIHAGKGWDKDRADLFVERRLQRLGIERPIWSEVPRGAIVGRATITDCWHLETCRAIERPGVAEQMIHWGFGPYCASLENVVPCKPFPYKGALGFFDVPEAVVQQLVWST